MVEVVVEVDVERVHHKQAERLIKSALYSESAISSVEVFSLEDYLIRLEEKGIIKGYELD